MRASTWSIFSQSASMKGRADAGKSGPSRAQSRFRDPEGDHWQIEVLTNGDTLLLATLNSSLPPRSRAAVGEIWDDYEWEVGMVLVDGPAGIALRG